MSADADRQPSYWEERSASAALKYKLLLLAFETSPSRAATSKCVTNVLGALLWRIQCMAYPSLN